LIIETIVLGIISSILLDTSKFTIEKLKFWKTKKEIINEDFILEIFKEKKINVDSIDIKIFITKLDKYLKEEGFEFETINIFFKKEYPKLDLNINDFYYSLANKSLNLLIKDEYFKSFVLSNLSSISSQILYLSQSLEKEETSKLDLYFLLETLSSITYEIKSYQEELIDEQKQLVQVILDFTNQIGKENKSLKILIEDQNEMQIQFFNKISENINYIYPNIKEKAEILDLYKRQMLARYGKLEFLGMPDFKEKPKVDLEEVFVPLRSKGISWF
jgi:hypothetical protein